jgi:hypothetical protein
MMRVYATLLVVTLLHGVSVAHDLPKPTEAGGKALDELVLKQA